MKNTDIVVINAEIATLKSPSYSVVKSKEMKHTMNTFLSQFKKKK